MSASESRPSPAAVAADGLVGASASDDVARDEPDAPAESSNSPEPGSDATVPDAAPEGATDVAEQLDTVSAERDDYLDQLQRHRAEFQNFRRRVESERLQQVSAGVGRLVESLLPVLDACDVAEAQGHTEVAAVGQALMVALGKAGLERIDAVGEHFDPTLHEAVTIEEAPTAPAEASGDDGIDASDDAAADRTDAGRQIVTAELRSGFRFDGRVLRAAMVKVRTG